MSATVTFKATDEFVCVFHSGKVDFGVNAMRVFDVKDVCDRHWNDKAFFGDDGMFCNMTGQELWANIDAREWTFGQFGGTVEVGSGHLATWLGL